MVFHVEIDPDAVNEIEEAYQWLKDRAPLKAVQWFNDLYSAIESLRMMPERCSLAPESAAFPVEIRQLLHGSRGRRFRILFTISGDTVQVLRVRHGAMRPIRWGSSEPEI